MVGDDEVNAEGFELASEGDELVKAVGEPVELGDHDHAHVAAPRGREQRAQGRSPFFRAAHPMVDAPRCAVEELRERAPSASPRARILACLHETTSTGRRASCSPGDGAAIADLIWAVGVPGNREPIINPASRTRAAAHRYSLAIVQVSSTSRTLVSRASAVNGFSRRATSWVRTP